MINTHTAPFWKYYGTVFLLGLVWCALLTITPATRVAVRMPTEYGDYPVLWTYLCILVAALVTARLSRRVKTKRHLIFMLSIRTLWLGWVICVALASIAMGVIVLSPYVASVAIFVTLMALLKSWYMVIPMAAICGIVMSKLVDVDTRPANQMMDRPSLEGSPCAFSGEPSSWSLCRKKI